MKYYRRVEIVDGESEEAVQFVGIHPLNWPGYIAPTAAFVESDEVEKLLRKIRDELANITYPAIWTAELINEIDALLGDEE